MFDIDEVLKIHPQKTDPGGKITFSNYVSRISVPWLDRPGIDWYFHVIFVILGD